MNIYQISQDLLSLFDEIEANGGEITPEQEQELAITQDALKDKVKSYVGVIQHYKDDLAAIKAEEARLKSLKDSKQKIIDRLSKVVIKAIDEFGGWYCTENAVEECLDLTTELIEPKIIAFKFYRE